MEGDFANPFREAEGASGAEEDAGLEDIDGGVAERGEVAFEVAFDAEVGVGRGGVGSNGGDEDEVLGTAGLGPAGEAEGEFVVDAAKGFWRAGDLDGGSEGAVDGSKRRGNNRFEVGEVGDPFDEPGVAPAG